MEVNKKDLISSSRGLKKKDYIGYALGDVGCCLVFSCISTLLQVYYTDVLLLNPLFIMIMFVAARLWDAINDPIVGRICDKIKPSKYGRYRPWLLYGAIPLAITTILVFIKWPSFGSSKASIGVSIYATFTYILFGMAYTTVQIPYGSLSSVVTLDEKERTKLSVFRSVGSTLGSLPVLIVQSLAIKKTVNYTTLIIGVIILTVLSVVMLFLSFKWSKERVKTEPLKKEKGATLKAIKRIGSNRAMLAISIASMLLLAGQMFTTSYYTYLFKDYFKKTGFFLLLPTVASYLPMAILMGFIPKLVRKFGKKEICGVGMLISTICNLGMFFLGLLNKDVSFWPFVILCFVNGFGFNLFVLQVWAMATDSIDYVEVKTKVREDATAYSFFMFFRKMGQVIAAIAVNGALLAFGYFDASKGSEFIFTDAQLKIMFNLATIIPAVLYGAMTLILFFWYPLSKQKVGELQVLKEQNFEDNNKIDDVVSDTHKNNNL